MSETFLTLDKVQEIEKQYPTPFYVYDERGIRRCVRGLLAAFSFNEGFKEYFAVKALPNPVILKLLRQEGCGVDCSSIAELRLAAACGFSGEEIMFTSNETLPHEFAYARELGAIINLDDITHIDFLDKCAGVPSTICLRYNPGGDFTINNAVMGNPSEAKYGLTRAQMSEAFEILLKKGVKRFGIHSFLASNTTDNAYYPHLAAKLFTLAAELHRECGANIDFINLSGGIGIPYRPEQQRADIELIGQGVYEAYQSILKPAGLGGVKLFTELGRYVTGPYGNLVTRAVHFKHIYKEYVGVDACAAHLIRPAMYGAYHHITVLGKEDYPSSNVYDIVGSLCENNDKFAINRRLPKIEIGDYLAIHDAGAHSHAMGYNYNGKLRCAEILLKKDGSFELIRRAETEKDLFATLDFLNLFDD